MTVFHLSLLQRLKPLFLHILQTNDVHSTHSYKYMSRDIQIIHISCARTRVKSQQQ